MSGYDFETLKVLVVDDSRPMRSLINSFLLGFGVKDTLEAADANEAFYEVKESTRTSSSPTGVCRRPTGLIWCGKSVWI